MIDSAVTLLPLPDSPTSPTVERAAISNDTPSTARTAPASIRNSVTRSRISSSVVASDAGAAIACEPSSRAPQPPIGPPLHDQLFDDQLARHSIRADRWPTRRRAPDGR